MDFIENEKVAETIAQYPKEARARLKTLRELIISTAREEGITRLVETTKWAEPSYVTKHGSTIRMDWKAKTPDHYYLFFICSTELVSTFRLIFGDELQFEDNRAIVLKIDEPLPKPAIQKCLTLALNYHKIKHLHMLGV